MPDCPICGEANHHDHDTEEKLRHQVKVLRSRVARIASTDTARDIIGVMDGGIKPAETDKRIEIVVDILKGAKSAKEDR